MTNSTLFPPTTAIWAFLRASVQEWGYFLSPAQFSSHAVANILCNSNRSLPLFQTTDKVYFEVYQMCIESSYQSLSFLVLSFLFESHLNYMNVKAIDL